jgi:alkylated DNA repair dioxygenase AlkB
MKNASMCGDGFVKDLPPGGELAYCPQWLPPERADALLAGLLAEIDWERRHVRMFGRWIAQPRLVRFQGDAGIRYRYSGDEHRADGWHPDVQRLRDELAIACGQRFDCVLLNRYRDGRDAMGWHADDEPELGRNPTIAAVSLGAERRFLLRRRDDPATRLELRPGHGSLIVMRGAVQHHWQHQLARTAKATGERVNLTFRRIRTA